MCLAGFIAKRHRRTRAFGRYVIAYAPPNQLGLFTSAWDRRRTQALPGLTGETACRR